MTFSAISAALGTYSEISNNRQAQSSEILEFHCEGEIPQFVGAELDRLYGSVYASLPHLASEGKLCDASAYFVRNGDELKTVLLYRRRGTRIEVLNEVFRLDEDEINRFSRYIFTVYKSMNIICFRAIQTNFKKSPYQYQRFNCLEDMVVDLPPSGDAYLNSLSTKTRSSLRRKLRVIARDHPSFQFEVFERDEIKAEQILEIIQYNKQRMAAGNKISIVADAAARRLVTLARDCGMLIVASIDGRVCGGAIICKGGDNYFGLMVSHDSKYNVYSLGLLCNYRALCEAIKRGAREFHFLWGRYPYKFALSASPKELDYLAIYRSRTQLLLHGVFALTVWVHWLERRYSMWKHDVKQKHGLLFNLHRKVLNFIRRDSTVASDSVEE